MKKVPFASVLAAVLLAGLPQAVRAQPGATMRPEGTKMPAAAKAFSADVPALPKSLIAPLGAPVTAVDALSPDAAIPTAELEPAEEPARIDSTAGSALAGASSEKSAQEEGPVAAHGAPLASARRIADQLAASPAPAFGGFGVDLSAMDPSVRPQDDLFANVNGGWLKKLKIQKDEDSAGVTEDLEAKVDLQINVDLKVKTHLKIKTLIDEASAVKNATADERRIADFYESFMDETGIVQARGLAPVAKDLRRIDAIKTKRGLPSLFAWAARQGVGTPIGLSVDPDAKNPKKYIVSLQQSGLGLPNRDAYFAADADSANIRAKYREFIAKLLALSGEADAEKNADVVFALETSLAQHQWTDDQLRDDHAVYNKRRTRDLGVMATGFDWPGYLRAAKVRRQEKDVIVGQPSYLAGFAEAFQAQPLETWKLYLKVRVLDASADYLPDTFVNAAFEYRGRTLDGTTVLAPRWKRGVDLVSSSLGEAVGHEYVKRHFPESSKKRVEAIVSDLRAAYAKRIQGLPWMSPTTKKKALAKLDKIAQKIGYPDKWIDYSKLQVKPGDLMGNVRRSSAFDYDRMLAKLGQPVDRGEWGMTPQTVNAQYDPSLNDITSPAGILQPPFFDPEADDAVNYGSIGAAMGHELTHAFDDQGSQYDGNGKMTNWWLKKDLVAYKALLARLVRQFSAFMPLPGLHIDGQKTLGENTADLGGLGVAFDAYMASLKGAQPPVIGGYTGEQRLFQGYAQSWREAQRDEALRQQILNNPHSPAKYRVNGIVGNMDAFVEAFGLKEGDGLFLTPDARITIW